MTTRTSARTASRAAILAAVAAGALAGASALAQQHDAAGHDAAGHGSMEPMAAPGSMNDVMQAMHDQMMAVEPSGNPNVDFVRLMIPHHQSAVDMARIYLDQGDDPQLRALAEDIVASQEAEIEMMGAWLESHAP